MDEKTISRLLTILIILVSTVWAVVILAVVFIEDAKAPPELNIVMMALVGLLTSSYMKTKKPELEEKTDDDR